MAIPRETYHPRNIGAAVRRPPDCDANRPINRRRRRAEPRGDGGIQALADRVEIARIVEAKPDRDFERLKPAQMRTNAAAV